MLPEEFPVVLTVFMAMGAWRISRARVLTRRAAAIETLGSATVLCTDKTGTLTENRMSIAELRVAADDASGRCERADGDAAGVVRIELVEFGLLASARGPFDPMEKAFHDLAAARLAEDASTARRAGRSCTPTACGPTCWRCPMSGRPDPQHEIASSPPRARRRRSPTCATSRLADLAR